MNVMTRPTFQMRVARSELEQWRAAAAGSGRTMTELVRAAVTAELEREPAAPEEPASGSPPATDYDALLRELRDFGG
jgi:hypothetical protein